MAMDTACTYSTVRNSSGGRMFFGFLGGHGKELAANEEYTVFGSIYEAIQGSRINRLANRRTMEAFEASLARGDLEIVSTPSPILESPAGVSKMLRYNGSNNLSLTDPCWSSSA